MNQTAYQINGITTHKLIIPSVFKLQLCVKSPEGYTLRSMTTKNPLILLLVMVLILLFWDCWKEPMSNYVFSLGTKFSTWEKGGTHVRLKKIKQETYSLESEMRLLVRTHEIFFL